MNNKKKAVNCMKIQYVDLFQDKFFTTKRLSEWKIFIAQCCEDVCEGLISKIAPENNISYFLSESLLDETIGDAVIGMSKIIDKTPHPVEEPNAFKIAAYLGYWFLRHKPISVLYPKNVDLNNIQIASNCNANPQYLSWQLKHINETIAVNIVTSFIFDFDKEICSARQCNRIKKHDSCDGLPNFGFEDFDKQRKIMLQKITYYFTYRAIAPKVIEHILEGYAFHPAWSLTGPHWNTSILEDITQISVDEVNVEEYQ